MDLLKLNIISYNSSKNIDLFSSNDIKIKTHNTLLSVENVEL